MLEEPTMLSMNEETDEVGPSEADIKLEKVLESMAWQYQQLSTQTAVLSPALYGSIVCM